jgi:LEA14-like dessication related protein
MRIGFTKLWGILTGLLVIGIIVYFAMLWVTSQNITAELKEIYSARYSIAENKLEICFLVEVNNSGLIDVTIEKIYYKVYINGEYFGEGSKENIVINRGTNRLNLCIKSPPSATLRSILIPLVNKGKVNVTIKGYIDIPIKSFGIIKMWTLELPYEKTVMVDLVSAGKTAVGPGPLPS